MNAPDNNDELLKALAQCLMRPEPFANRSDLWWVKFGANPRGLHDCGKQWREHRYTEKGGVMCPP